MKKFLLLLSFLLLISACKKDADAPWRGSDPSSEETVAVTFDLVGSLDLPKDDLDQQGRALTLIPGQKAGKAVLSPTYETGDKVEAVCYVTNEAKTVSSGPHPITFTVGGDGGNKLLFHGNVEVASSLVGQKILLSAFTNFTPTSFAPSGYMKEHPSVAPLYAKNSANRTPISNFPIALQAKTEIPYRTETKNGVSVGSYRDLSMKFKLVGSLIRCEIKNDTEQELTVTGLELHGLGAGPVSLQQTGSGGSKEYFVTSDVTSPTATSRVYQLASPLTLQARQSSDAYYLVYAPQISQEDGSANEYRGYIRPILRGVQAQREFSGDETMKSLSQDRAGKLLTTSIVIMHKSPIQPDAIPLQYWLGRYHVRSGSFDLPLGHITYDGGLNLYNIAGLSKFTDHRNAHFSPEELTVTEVNNHNSPTYHVPTVEEFNGVLPPGFEVNPGSNNIPVYYQQHAAYSPQEKAESIEVAGYRMAGRSTYWRAPIESELPEDVVRQLYWQGELSLKENLYALRFGKLSDAEIASYKAKGVDERLTDKELARDDRSRVAYMYEFTGFIVNIRSCYIGSNPAIKTAQDLYTKEVFKANSYNGYPVFRRYVQNTYTFYSSPSVNSGTIQEPIARSDYKQSVDPPSKRDFTVTVPAGYRQSVEPVYPPFGFLFRKSRKEDTFKSVWIHRPNEGFPSPHGPKVGWVFEGTPRADGTKEYFIKDLPVGGKFYFSIPLMNNEPTTNH